MTAVSGFVMIHADMDESSRTASRLGSTLSMVVAGRLIGSWVRLAEVISARDSLGPVVTDGWAQ